MLRAPIVRVVLPVLIVTAVALVAAPHRASGQPGGDVLPAPPLPAPVVAPAPVTVAPAQKPASVPQKPAAAQPAPAAPQPAVVRPAAAAPAAPAAARPTTAAPAALPRTGTGLAADTDLPVHTLLAGVALAVGALGAASLFVSRRQ